MWRKTKGLASSNAAFMSLFSTLMYVWYTVMARRASAEAC
jgi:hypothetical protein